MSSTPGKPLVFIGSSTEGKSVAEHIQVNLQEVCRSTVWDQGIFAPGSTTLESLVSQVEKYDFGILVFSPDDIVQSRNVGASAPRDNVLIELGLFVGAIGRHRTFVVFDRTARLKIPTDLAGVTLVAYDPPSSDVPWAAAVGPASVQMKDEIARQGKRSRKAATLYEPPVPPSPSTEQQAVIENLIETHSDIIGVDAPPPGLDTWYRVIRPVLHESTYYTTPTYYLDANLNIIDWNAAFELIFKDSTPHIRYQHVNAFIARLLNSGDVFDHAREFTGWVHNGHLPYTDIEKLAYRSSRYGDVLMRKVATQLHSPSGQLQAWSVALLLEKLDWALFVKDLRDRIWHEKLWSVYASAYDRILSEFAPYHDLLKEVTSVIPATATTVVDIGAGTGNVSKLLLDRGLRVTSIEFSATMIDRMRAKGFDPKRHRVIKARAEALNALGSIPSESFDAATLVNVLYGLDDPYACLTGVNRLLKRGGVVGLSTTHSGVHLDPLLDAIKVHLAEKGQLDACAHEFNLLYDINKEIERTVARRYSHQDYCSMVEEAGFVVEKEVPYTYVGAVNCIHGRKR
jgi:SAM-dependent methyltransferase